MKQVVTTKKAPCAVGPYSQAIRVQDTLYVSGQLPIDAKTGMMPYGVEKQTEQSIKNIQEILAVEGFLLSDVVKTTVFLSDMNEFAIMNGMYANYFVSPFPSRSTVAVAALPKGAKVEIECIAQR
ncbi:MAG: RidA family protein [Sphaerochaetaceae bacterium]